MDPKLTAFAIARVRADEGRLPPAARLFDDPYGHLFDDAQVDVDPVFEAIPFFREHVRLRTRFIDDCVREAVQGGTRQVVIVGAGFDCRALRMPELAAASARVVEIDHEAQLREKKERLDRAGVTVPPFARAVAADLSAEDPAPLSRGLREAGIRGDAPTLWICEGLLGYLAAASIDRLAAVTRELSGRGSALVANHHVYTWSSEVIVEKLGRAGWKAGPGPAFRELHARWIGGDGTAGSELFGFVVARA